MTQRNSSTNIQNPKFWILFLFTIFFLLRVLVHFFVRIISVEWFPPESEWLSGALPYQYLLASQILILFSLFKVCRDFWYRSGYFYKPNNFLTYWLLPIGITYLLAMVLRYILRMSLYSPERWTGGSIPVFFHWVLAAIVITIAIHQIKSSGQNIFQASTLGWIRRLSMGLIIAFGFTIWLIHSLLPSYLSISYGIGSPKNAVKMEKNVKFLTSDGISLVSNIYHPIRVGDVPTILVRVPYTRTFSNSYKADLVGRIWSEQGYTVVFQGVRGRGGSGGNYYPFLNEEKDGIETLEWLSKQEWFDGRLGMWGGSYFGYTQWLLAGNSDPGPSAMGIQIASTDFYQMFYPGGAFSLESALHWAFTSGPKKDVSYELTDIEKAVSGFPLIDSDNRVKGEIPYFNDWASHPSDDAFWKSSNTGDRIPKLNGPIHMMAGWYDAFLPSQLRDFSEIKKTSPTSSSGKTRLVIGPWAHARSVTLSDGYVSPNYRVASISPSIKWFDEHLKGIPTQETSPIKIFVMGKNEWRNENEWPLSRTNFTPYYLESSESAKSIDGDGKLILTRPTYVRNTDIYEYDPENPVPSSGGSMLGPRSGVAQQNHIEKRNDVLVFSSAILENDMEITGPIKAILYVSSDALATDFTAKLVDVYPNGNAYNVTDGILRLPLDSMKKEDPNKISIELWPTSQLIKKGHRIRLEISSSNYPRFDRNPNTGNTIHSETHTKIATQTIYHGKSYPSHILLPLIVD